MWACNETNGELSTKRCRSSDCEFVIRAALYTVNCVRASLVRCFTTKHVVRRGRATAAAAAAAGLCAAVSSPELSPLHLFTSIQYASTISNYYNRGSRVDTSSCTAGRRVVVNGRPTVVHISAILSLVSLVFTSRRRRPASRSPYNGTGIDTPRSAKTLRYPPN